jgi:hypothetical protein
MGFILYELCASFKTGMERRESLERLRRDHTINEHVLKEHTYASELILQMTKYTPCERPSAEKIISSDLFRRWKSEAEL